MFDNDDIKNLMHDGVKKVRGGLFWFMIAFISSLIFIGLSVTVFWNVAMTISSSKNINIVNFLASHFGIPIILAIIFGSIAIIAFIISVFEVCHGLRKMILAWSNNFIEERDQRIRKQEDDRIRMIIKDHIESNNFQIESNGLHDNDSPDLNYSP